MQTRCVTEGGVEARPHARAVRVPLQAQRLRTRRRAMRRRVSSTVARPLSSQSPPPSMPCGIVSLGWCPHLEDSRPTMLRKEAAEVGYVVHEVLRHFRQYLSTIVYVINLCVDGNISNRYGYWRKIEHLQHQFLNAENRPLQHQDQAYRREKSAVQGEMRVKYSRQVVLFK